MIAPVPGLDADGRPTLVSDTGPPWRGVGPIRTETVEGYRALLFCALSYPRTPHVPVWYWQVMDPAGNPICHGEDCDPDRAMRTAVEWARRHFGGTA